MDSQRWGQIQSVFLAALDRQADDREAFLDHACAGEPDMRQEVEALLRGHSAEHALAIEGKLLIDERPPESDDDPLLDTHLGPYRILQRIGQGGMGDVFLAERDDDQYRQNVAIKVVRAGFGATDLAQRFRAERQILARLIHPNIARLLDAGITGDGRPYLVMEAVTGIPITGYCDERSLSIDERLRLFIGVCEAVHFAHRNLIVHRDVKPANVLVTQDGDVKLLDFGIAKLLDPDTDVSIPLTRTAARVMTPEYAAPEQVRGEAITTATDVYALGTLLYELLTGHRPHRFPTHTPAEIERIICAEEPTAPSTVVITREEVATTGGTVRVVTPELVSAARGTQAARLQRTLRGDLDNIVMMAMRKEPDRRYGSAAQLAEDIDAYLQGRPVIARKDTWGYRARKFVRRNRTAVAVAAGVFALVLGFGIIMAVQAFRISAQSSVIAQERDRAQLEAEKATQVAGFLVDLFQAPDPYAASDERRDTLRLRDFLAQGATKVQSELATQPAVQAQLLGVLGGVYQNLGDLDAAQPLLEHALEIRTDLYGNDHLEVAESQQALASLWKAKGEYAGAEALQRQALATRRAHLPSEHADIAASVQLLGTLRHDQGDYEAADSLYREALAMRRSLFGDDNLEVAATEIALSTLVAQRGDFQAAEPLVRSALEARRRVLGEGHPEVAMTMGQLAGMLGRLGDPEAAERMYRDALRILRESLGPNHPDVAFLLNNLAYLLRSQDRYAEAEPVYREALQLWRTLLGNEHPNVALTMHNLGAVLKAKGDLDEAEHWYREALAMRRKLLGESHPSVAASLHNLGVLLKERGDYGAAAPLLQQAIAVNVETLGPQHPRVAITMEALGDLWFDAGQYARAEPLFIDALDIYGAQPTPNESTLVALYRRLYQLYLAWDKPEQAARYKALIP